MRIKRDSGIYSKTHKTAMTIELTIMKTRKTGRKGLYEVTKGDKEKAAHNSH